MSADIIDYVRSRIKDADHIEVRACDCSVSIVLFDDKGLPYAACSFRAEAWLPILRELTGKCMEIVGA
jgi:hypothetical protein